MKRIVALTLLGLIAAVPALAQVAEKKPDAALPTVDQILDKYVQATGGKAANQKITSRVMKGNFEIPAMGVAAPVELYAKAPNKTAFIIDIPGFGVVREGYDGKVAWGEDPQQGLREKSGVELADAVLDSDFYQSIRLKELYPKMTLKGKEKVGEQEAYVIEAVPAAGSPAKFYFDTQTGLLIRTDAERETPQGKMAVEAYTTDYKEFDGVKIPTTVRQVTPVMTFAIKITEVKNNVPIEDAKFAKPAVK